MTVSKRYECIIPLLYYTGNYHSYNIHIGLCDVKSKKEESEIFVWRKCTSEREVKTWRCVTGRPRDLPGLERTIHVTQERLVAALVPVAISHDVSLSLILQHSQLRRDLYSSTALVQM